jgi:hypothetical protein
MGALLTGKFDHLYDTITVIDARYPFEFRGGHVRGAINIVHPGPLEEILFANPQGGSRTALVFHCEFSQCRGPQMYRHVRGLDRDLHGFAHFPNLHYPEMFLIKDGYRAFSQAFPDLCEPSGYVPMTDLRFAEELRAEKLASRQAWAAKSSERRARFSPRLDAPTPKPLKRVTSLLCVSRGPERSGRRSPDPESPIWPSSLPLSPALSIRSTSLANGRVRFNRRQRSPALNPPRFDDGFDDGNERELRLEELSGS